MDPAVMTTGDIILMLRVQLRDCRRRADGKWRIIKAYVEGRDAAVIAAPLASVVEYEAEARRIEEILERIGAPLEAP